MDLNATITAFRQAAQQPGAANPKISAWNVGQQVRHCCIAMTGMSKELAASKPPMPAGRWSFAKFFVFTFGVIPRGRAKSPEVAIPRSGATTEELLHLLDESQQALEAAQQADPESWFRHPYFGPLKRDATLKFIAIHNNHHLKIVREILAS